MASQAACLSSAGEAKSGIPCARFTHLYWAAMRDISRMTDSVKVFAFCEMRFLISGEMLMITPQHEFRMRSYRGGGLAKNKKLFFWSPNVIKVLGHEHEDEPKQQSDGKDDHRKYEYKVY